MVTDEDHVRPLRQASWEAAEAIARQLVGRGTDVNEVQKVVTHARVQAEHDPARVGEDFFRLLETMVRDGRYLVRSRQTLDYYGNLSDACNQHLREYRRTTPESGWELVAILGWAARLMRYYNTPEGKSELTSKQRGVGCVAESDNVSTTSAATSQQPAHSQEQTRQKRPAPPPPPPKPKPRQETARESVTLLSEVKGGKARVRTERGEELTCTGMPSYPRASTGDVCRADVTREDGKALKAFFKGFAS